MCNTVHIRSYNVKSHLEVQGSNSTPEQGLESLKQIYQTLIKHLFQFSAKIAIEQHTIRDQFSKRENGYNQEKCCFLIKKSRGCTTQMYAYPIFYHCSSGSLIIKLTSWTVLIFFSSNCHGLQLMNYCSFFSCTKIVASIFVKACLTNCHIRIFLIGCLERIQKCFSIRFQRQMTSLELISAELQENPELSLRGRPEL